ncbi:GEgh 16 [Mycena sanguinolenta]|uniref:GEgh 16 n=1 Tax=Mycena sanguinolenta TaxID=230812 RepID=A0A8H6XDZ7_9AGAR|nr:GEgh 16 [Mycena sanguinolenta]
MFFNTFIVLAAISSSALLNVQAHGTITSVTGANGVTGAGFGIIASTPRDGSTPNPFEQDTSVIRNNAIASGKTGVCGSTKAGGNNDVASQLAAASQAGLPTAAADGTVTMNLHQVNQDGAGPYTCDPATVTTQVPGVFGLSTAKATDFALAAQIPAGMTCAGGPNGDACIMRCRNPALAGPFGSCVAVAQSGTASTGNSTAAATADTAATDAATAATAATAGTTATPATAATDATAATGAKGGLAGLLSKLGGAKKAATAKRYINSRVAGKRSGYWLDNQ